ncbi:MAG TPA: hypothetical protein VL595_33090 [Pseudonocardia sp.]|jgi:hypothetical protein|nr:hypothetical protein [Pseudonocardia sp.]
MPHRDWSLTHDAVIPFGDEGECYVLHARAFEAGEDEDPVVIMGQFSDHAGRSITNSVAEAMAAVQTALYPEGRRLRFVEMRPEHPYDSHAVLRFTEISFANRRRVGRARRWWREKADERGRRWQATFTLVTPEGITRHVFPSAVPQHLPWTFTPAVWSPDFELQWPESESNALVRDVWHTTLVRPAQVRIPALLGDCGVDVWPRDLYVAELIGGPEGAEIAAQRRAACDRSYSALGGIIDAYADPPPDSFLEEGHERNPEL